MSWHAGQHVTSPVLSTLYSGFLAVCWYAYRGQLLPGVLGSSRCEARYRPPSPMRETALCVHPPYHSWHLRSTRPQTLLSVSVHSEWSGTRSIGRAPTVLPIRISSRPFSSQLFGYPHDRASCSGCPAPCPSVQATKSCFAAVTRRNGSHAIANDTSYARNIYKMMLRKAMDQAPAWHERRKKCNR